MPALSKVTSVLVTVLPVRSGTGPSRRVPCPAGCRAQLHPGREPARAKEAGCCPGRIVPRQRTALPAGLLAVHNGGVSPASLPAEVGAFLKARRAQLWPRDVGLPADGARRKADGLRREEVAQVAAISVDYYTRLEQGRVRASASVLATLAGALRL